MLRYSYSENLQIHLARGDRCVACVNEPLFMSLQVCAALCAPVLYDNIKLEKCGRMEVIWVSFTSNTFISLHTLVLHLFHTFILYMPHLLQYTLPSFLHQCTRQGACPLVTDVSSVICWNISDLNSVFTPGKSTTDHILPLCVLVGRWHEFVQGMLAACVNLNLKKAFDSVYCEALRSAPLHDSCRNYWTYLACAPGPSAV